MSLLAAVITSQGTGAIATVGLCGGDAADVITEIFRSSKKNAGKIPASRIERGQDARVTEEGCVLVGNIIDGDEVVDNVVIGCEAKDYFAIHCHGNPLITERVLELLAGQGAEVVSSEQLMAAVLASKGVTSIGVEVSLAQAQCKTLEGAKLLAYQTKHGIYGFASRIIGGKLHPFGKDAKGCHPDSYAFELNLEEAKDCAHKILKNSAAAKLMIFGCTAVLIGPPNSGKSTLLNCLCGKSKAIVSDIAGTTRDWVTGNCKTNRLFLNLVDTAGLAEELTKFSAIEAVSQQKSIEQVDKADIALLLIDSSSYDAAAITALLQKVEIPIVTVINKSDLSCPSAFFDLPNPISISAKQGTGITELLELIENVSGVYGLDANSAIAFTERQELLVNEISQCKTLKDAQMAAAELLNGRVYV